MPHLVNYRWPGNVRELENVTERLVLLCRSDEVGVADLPAQHPAAPDVARTCYSRSREQPRLD